MVCFFAFHETSESPIKTQKPETDLLVSLHPAQSESEKALIFKEDFDEKKNLLTWIGF